MSHIVSSYTRDSVLQERARDHDSGCDCATSNPIAAQGPHVASDPMFR